ncbi:serine hydrolase domain-containing protein [Alteromonas sp. a30]|uniref:serine hydrolase domain-containing protein n=1 Tax=Alteromonas sp. a30 TaxID=2730917 RepID=UPI00227E15B7|nr:serine hydrolase domain-containing protein [Alteromonas sp. a30]MCY7294177.1 beta-lactamase family protein [Alteromonas sp. a30]
MKIPTFLISLFFLTALFAQSQESNALQTSPQNIKQWQTAVEASAFSGLVLVAHKGEALFQYKFGLANREENIPFSQESIFDIGSITKQFTATAIMQLSEAGKLSVQEPITRFFKNVPVDKQNITLHHLLTHSSGLPQGFGLYQKVDKHAFLQEVMSAELIAAPGTEYHYSNVGYNLLASIIESVTGQNQEEYVLKNILYPAGLSETGYQLVEREPARLVINYGRDPNWLQRLFMLTADSQSVGHSLQHHHRDPGPRWYIHGAGGFLSTTYDMLRWYQTLRTRPENILQKASWDKLFTPYIAEQNKNTEKLTSHYGYGWSIDRDEHGNERISHSGSNGYNLSEFTYYPTLDVFIFKTTNNWDDSPEDLIKQFDALILEQILPEQKKKKLAQSQLN